VTQNMCQHRHDRATNALQQANLGIFNLIGSGAVGELLHNFTDLVKCGGGVVGAIVELHADVEGSGGGFVCLGDANFHGCFPLAQIGPILEIGPI